jgi:hypothetical protein
MKAKSERRRPFIGDQVEECRDASGLFYLLPFQKVDIRSLFLSNIQQNTMEYLSKNTIKQCNNLAYLLSGQSMSMQIQFRPLI